jgi:KDO2-lipid IV(A) lauroyltransferase
MGWRRELITRHLEFCLPEVGAAGRELIRRDFYRYLGELAAEVLYAPSISRQALQERVRLINPQLVAEALRDGGRVLILSAHHCNWEWLLLRCSLSFEAPLTAPFKRTSHPRVDSALCALRERFGGTMIPSKQLLQHLLEKRGRVPLLAMLADQSPAVVNPEQSWVQFFGRPTAFHTGPGWIGAKFGYTVVLAAMQREKRGQFSVRFVELASATQRMQPEQILDAYVRALENHVRAHPEQYFWAYNRWKRERPLYG